jgi:hypothetical protein
MSGTLSVRPEDVRIHRNGASNPTGGGIKGQITETIYLGNSVRIGAMIAERSLLWADLRDDEAQDLTIGSNVTLSWPASAAIIWASTA